MFALKLALVVLHVVLIVYFNRMIDLEQRESARKEAARLARLAALGFQVRPRDKRPVRIDWQA
jgi:hypothetical protein